LPATSGHNHQTTDDYSLLKMVGSGLYKTVFFPAITIVVVELSLQLEEEIASGLPPSPQTKTVREPLYRAMNYMAKLATDRIRMGGDTNFKGPVIFSAATALIHAKGNGIPPEQVVPGAAKRAGLQCLELLTARMKKNQEEVGPENTRGTINGMNGSSIEQDFGFDFMMPDAGLEFGGMQEGSFGLQIEDSWLFTNWDAN